MLLAAGVEVAKRGLPSLQSWQGQEVLNMRLEQQQRIIVVLVDDSLGLLVVSRCDL